MQYTQQPLPMQAPRKFTQIWIFGLKIYHLATLDGMRTSNQTKLSSSMAKIKNIGNLERR
jgi:hypothetical protein